MSEQRGRLGYNRMRIYPHRQFSFALILRTEAYVTESYYEGVIIVFHVIAQACCVTSGLESDNLLDCHLINVFSCGCYSDGCFSTVGAFVPKGEKLTPVIINIF